MRRPIRPALLAAVLLAVSCGPDHPIDVSPDPIVVSTTTLPPAVQGSSYSATVQASGGVPPYAWTLQAGALPAGIALDGATGTLSGTATESGDFPVTIRVTDAASETADVELAIHVEGGDPPPLAVTPPGPLVVTIGAAGLHPVVGHRRDSPIPMGRVRRRSGIGEQSPERHHARGGRTAHRRSRLSGRDLPLLDRPVRCGARAGAPPGRSRGPGAQRPPRRHRSAASGRRHR